MMSKFIIIIVVLLPSVIALAEGGGMVLYPLSGHLWTFEKPMVINASITLADGSVVEGGFATFTSNLYVMPDKGNEAVIVSLEDMASIDRHGRRGIHITLKDGTVIKGKWASSPVSAKAVFIHSVDDNNGYILSLDNRLYHVDKEERIVSLSFE
ncbi:MAG: hypothetical protein B6D57_01725 [Candidatus Coatesbacteria bacterium 4484_99]|uniref:Uncharacterized protein n=1 Tax=Candidatus Coatesbacteria bacterium 4484_99 TaxID=1970774 RepID=A0A1W9S252_9BACT|nr:MAG: hypothetical protein B6D57_01725 [Candidatus Coatesbacteria bacterium 4484_99]RLC44918.1 MAG: hypothetical protein DRH44_00810 [Candidatus Coatesbacteria bacterium]